MTVQVPASPVSGVNGQRQFATKTVTFTGAASLGAIGAVPLFTTTGQVFIERITATVVTDCVGATATLSLGVTGALAQFIAATVATLLLAATRIWTSVTPVANAQVLPAIMQNTIVETNIVGTVATAAITAGAVRFDVIYTALSSGASLT